MRLQDKINTRFLLLIIAVFSVAGVVLYFMLGIMVDRNIDDMLESKAVKIKQNLQQHTTKEIITESPDQSIKISPVNHAHRFKQFSDTVIYDPHDKEYISHRKMTFDVVANGKSYEVAILMSRLESEDMIEVIFYFMLGLFVFIALFLFILNRWLSSSVWKPFFSTLEKLKNLTISEKEAIQFENSSVYEFAHLNGVLTEMVQKIQADFTNLKAFTENASHEMQTPVAVIKSKLEMALQDKTLSSERYNQVHIAYEAASRLSKLNEALLLLSKIENRQFIEEADTDLCLLIQQRLQFIEELIELKKVKVTEDFRVPVRININPYLAEILIHNLLNNALKHNMEGGQIRISSTDRKITFSNTGKPLTIEPDKLFQRFVKQNAGSDSTGLGLAIASEICKNYKLSLQYNYNNGLHNIVITNHDISIR